ncbi:hypothetical protein KCP74_03205 [Salmonella enterica subsp. enterica]|nr:hypothetical protein KCP74_03205 [Salmonella enterica subsp. enterica]
MLDEFGVYLIASGRNVSPGNASNVHHVAKAFTCRCHVILRPDGDNNARLTMASVVIILFFRNKTADNPSF